MVQWATGAVGSLALRQIIQDDRFELVGVYVYSADKDGRDAGELVGLPPVGILATCDRSAILALDADAVIHTPLAPSMAEMDEDVLALLASGKNVISTAGYFAPQARGADLVARIEEACRAGGTSLHGGGIEPGFMFDRVAPLMTGMCSSIEHIHLWETIDARTHPAVQMMSEALSIGKPLDAISEHSPFFQYFKAMFTEVATAFGEAIGIAWDTLTVDVEVAPATCPIDTAIGRIEAGTIAGNRYTVRGSHAGRALLTLQIHWFVERNIAGWPMPAERYRWGVEIDGTPSTRTIMDVTAPPDAPDPGFTGCAAAAVNAIADVVAAQPGHFRPPVFAPWRPRTYPFGKAA